MGSRKENAILTIMGLIMLGLFLIAMIHPKSADAAFIVLCIGAFANIPIHR